LKQSAVLSGQRGGCSHERKQSGNGGKFDRRNCRRRAGRNASPDGNGKRAATGGGSMDLTSILSNVAGGGVGGAILMAIIGIIKNKMAKS